MSSVATPRILAASAVIVATALVWSMRGRDANVAGSLGSAPVLAPAAEPQERAAAAEPAETPVAAKLRELAALSETYRNTTFLIAIRDAGFICRDLESVYGGVDSSTTWTAYCRDMLAYTVGIASSGSLFVEPMVPHLDSIAPAPRDGERFVLPPQPLR